VKNKENSGSKVKFELNNAQKEALNACNSKFSASALGETHLYITLLT
jgi:hypothetical protein